MGCATVRMLQDVRVHAAGALHECAVRMDPGAGTSADNSVQKLGRRFALDATSGESQLTREQPEQGVS